ncbi:hypothetical protein HDV63DRAFT_183115 [Trichoderma sp. SZMC 28014]
MGPAQRSRRVRPHKKFWVTQEAGKATKAIGAAHPQLGIGLVARVYRHKWPRRRAGGTWLIGTEAEAETWRLDHRLSQ